MVNEKAFGCVANTIRLRSGKYLDLKDPRPDQFTIEDIAGALSKICRFGGQIEQFYSVADHSINCVLLADKWLFSPSAQRAILLHDAAEAFIGDVVKPLKIMLSDYGEIEHRMETAIEEAFRVDFALHADDVRTVDRAMLIAERRRFFTPDKVAWHGEDTVIPVEWSFGPPRSWHRAEEDFMELARSLGLAK